MTTHTTRRTLLRIAPAALVPGLLADLALAATVPNQNASSALASGDAWAGDPLPALVTAYLDTCEAFNVEDHEPTANALYDDMTRLGDRIEGTIATTPAGLAAQISYLQSSYGAGFPAYPGGPEYVDVPSPLLDLLKAGLRRL